MKNLTYIVLLFFATSVIAQEFQTPSFTFSHKKKAYLTLSGGEEIIGTIDKIKRTKGLIEEIRVIDGSGSKRKLSPSDVSYMYLPPSGLDKVGNAISTATDTQKWSKSKLDEDLLNQGLVYFEQATVRIKKKTETLLVQLLNPRFSARVKVYHDPKAKETASIGVAGFNVTGGIAKSYYIQKESDAAAYLFDKAGYKKEFSVFWNCSAMEGYTSEEKAWRELAKHVATYTTECE